MTMNHNQYIALSESIMTAIADASVEYEEIAGVLQDREARQWIIRYIGAVHETDRHAPEPTGEDIRALAYDLGFARDESTDQVLESMGLAGRLLATERAAIQYEFGVSPWERGRLIEYATALYEMIDAGMGDVTLNDAVRILDTLALRDD